MSTSANIARHLPLMAARQPDHPALKVARGRTADGAIDYLSLSFAELDAEVNAWCTRLSKAGVGRGDRTLIMVKQGLPLIAAVFALFKLGAVPIVIDPGMGLKSFLRCVGRSQPRALVGIPLAQFLSRVFLRTFWSVKVRVSARSSETAQLTSKNSKKVDQFAPAEVASDELAAILFTSGSTGAPKGVCYEHGMFEAQVRLIREHYKIEPGEIDLPMLPIFALFNPALGMTTIVPEIDPRRPAEVDPAKIVQAILQEGVTNSFGSPTLWSKIQQHCLANKITLPSLKRVLCAGAPVPAALWDQPARWMPNGTLQSPYGATESLPVSSVSASEIDPETVDGACVGRPLPEIEVKIINIVDGPLETFNDTEEMITGEIGEIIVRGPVVTKTYDARPRATLEAKIRDGDTIWHRMGDCGFLDAEGRLWFCGRKVERVQQPTGSMFTEPCEQVFRAHSRISRCALIALGLPGKQKLAIVVELDIQDSHEARALARELRHLARSHVHTSNINTFFFHPKLPVDIRHNAKIHRLKLAEWAATAKGFESDPKR
jgi:olefin beta-lactone synthetase